MELLESINDTPITVIISTLGGYEYPGMAIYDRIKDSKCHITIRGYGAVMSMGSIILQAADERQLSPNATIMIHDGDIEDMSGSPKTVKSWANWNIKLLKQMYEIFYEKMKKKDKNITLKKIEQMCQNDYIIDSQRAIDIGLADKIYTGEN